MREAGSASDYLLWALCSLVIFVGLGLIPYEDAQSGFWQECVWLVRDRRAVALDRVAVVGFLFAATAWAAGWLLQLVIVERFGRLTVRPPDQAADYDDISPPPPIL